MTIDQAYFQDMYAGSDDPWRFRTRWYERRKRAVTMAALLRPRYRRGFEPGCSNGMLSRELAKRCDYLLASDANSKAVAQAYADLKVFDNVEVVKQSVPHDWPDGHFDLIVLSELGYYFGEGELQSLLDTARQCLSSDGELVLCHWRHPVPEYPLTGDKVHGLAEASLEMRRVAHHLEDDFALDVWAHNAQSVAAREGLA